MKKQEVKHQRVFIQNSHIEEFKDKKISRWQLGDVIIFKGSVVDLYKTYYRENNKELVVLYIKGAGVLQQLERQNIGSLFTEVEIV